MLYANAHLFTPVQDRDTPAPLDELAWPPSIDAADEIDYDRAEEDYSDFWSPEFDGEPDEFADAGDPYDVEYDVP